MVNPGVIEELSRKLSSLIPVGAREIGEDVEKNMRAALTGVFSRLDLVTREEFEVQTSVLARTREKLVALERRVADLESRLRAAQEETGAP